MQAPILSKNNSLPRFASCLSIGRTSRGSMLEPALPVKPWAASAATNCLSKSCAAPTLAVSTSPHIAQPSREVKSDRRTDLPSSFR